VATGELKEVRMKQSTLAIAAAASLMAILAIQAQQPAPGRDGKGGSGFTQPEPIDFSDREGWQSIFDGVSLKGWDGSPRVWRVEGGAIVGQSRPESPAGTTYAVWEGGEPANFELKAEVKLEGEGKNSGIQYRSARDTQPRTGADASNAEFLKWNLKGYQADIDFANRFTGQFYEQGTGRGIISWRGQVVRAEQGKKMRLLSVVGDSDALKALIKPGEWNQMHIIARGNTMIHMVNGHVMSIFIDDDPSMARSNGVIGLQIEGRGEIVKVSYRNLWLKTL
jgi:hypothetical protein